MNTYSIYGLGFFDSGMPITGAFSTLMPVAQTGFGIYKGIEELNIQKEGIKSQTAQEQARLVQEERIAKSRIATDAEIAKLTTGGTVSQAQVFASAGKFIAIAIAVSAIAIGGAIAFKKQ